MSAPVKLLLCSLCALPFLFIFTKATIAVHKDDVNDSFNAGAARLMAVIFVACLATVPVSAIWWILIQ